MDHKYRSDVHLRREWVVSQTPTPPKPFLAARPAFNGKQTKPRNRTTNGSAFVQLKKELNKIKSEMNPSIRTFRPPIQPSPIKEGAEGRWSYARYRVTKAAAITGGSIPVSIGDLATAIGFTSVDFQIDRLCVWLMGSPDYQRSELGLTTSSQLVPATVGFTISDYGTANRPPSVGVEIPRTLGVIQNAATGSNIGNLLTVTHDGTGIAGSSPATIVIDFWVLYRRSN